PRSELFFVAGNAFLLPVNLHKSVNLPHLHFPSAVWPWNALPHPVKADKSVPADFSQLEPVFGQAISRRKRPEPLLRQPVNWPFSGRSVNAPVLLVTPLSRLAVQVFDIREPSACHEILFNEL